MSTRAQRRAQRASLQRTRPMRIAPLAAALVVFVVIAGVVIVNRMTSAAPVVEEMPSGLSVGHVAPPFSVMTSAGQFTLATEQGPVLLEVFASWCPHCQRETATLNRLYGLYGSRIHFVAVTGSGLAMDRASPESQADVDAFAQFFHIEYPIAFDPSLGVAKAYFQDGFPTIVLIGADKRVVYVHAGEISSQALARVILPALEGSK